jgi:hypothetical protein
VSANVKTACPKYAPFDRAPDGTVGHNSLAEARRRLLAGWTQSVAGGWPDIPPSGIAYERYVERTLAGVQVHMDAAAQRRRDELLARWLTVALFAIAAVATLASLWLAIKGG